MTAPPPPPLPGGGGGGGGRGWRGGGGGGAPPRASLADLAPAPLPARRAGGGGGGGGGGSRWLRQGAEVGAPLLRVDDPARVQERSGAESGQVVHVQLRPGHVRRSEEHT